MKVKTKFGEVEILDDKVIRFDEGLPGFENLRDFAIISNGTEPVMWLVSLEDENVALPVINPWLVRIDYSVDIPDYVKEDLGIENPEDVQIWAILVIPPDNPEDMTINLLAPIVINLKTNRGKQIILENEEYGIRHKVREELERSKRLAEVNAG